MAPRHSRLSRRWFAGSIRKSSGHSKASSTSDGLSVSVNPGATTADHGRDAVARGGEVEVEIADRLHEATARARSPPRASRNAAAERAVVARVDPPAGKGDLARNGCAARRSAVSTGRSAPRRRDRRSGSARRRACRARPGTPAPPPHDVRRDGVVAERGIMRPRRPPSPAPGGGLGRSRSARESEKGAEGHGSAASGFLLSPRLKSSTLMISAVRAVESTPEAGDRAQERHAAAMASA